MRVKYSVEMSVRDVGQSCILRRAAAHSILFILSDL